MHLRVRRPAGGEDVPAHVVLLSDGTNTTGRSLAEAVQEAVSAGIPVSTIAYGTPEGEVEVDQRRIRVPVDAPALADLADSTGGTAYEASGDELEDVHDDIGSAVGTTTEPREVSAGVAGLALLSAVGAGAAALAWSPRSLGRPAPCPGRAGPLAIMESLHMAHAQQAPARGQQLHDRRRRASMPHPRINRRRSPAPP